MSELETHQRRRGRDQALQFERAPGAAGAPLSGQARTTYERHRPERTPLYPLVVEHLETLLARACERTEHGFGYPRYVRRTFEAYLSCGMPQAGFCRVRCGSCGFERIVAFSCKLRGLCPGCAARRMADTAAHLVDRVLPVVRYRQWVLSLPFSLRMMAARDPALRSEVLRILLQRVFAWQRRQARELGVDDPKPAAVSFLHLFGSALNLHPHSHSLLPDAVFRRRAGQVEIVPLLAPTDEEVQAICAQVARRVLRRVEARLDDGVDLGDDHAALVPVPSPLPMPWAHRDEGAFEHPADRGRRCAEVDGFSLHAGVAVAAEDRVGLERLCRYGLRPSFALERLSLLDDGRVRYRLKRPWPRPGGVTEFVLDPVDFLARLTALIPAPRVNMCRYHGVFAPASPLRGQVIPRQVGPCRHAQASGAVKTGTAGGWPGSSGADRGHVHAHGQDDVGVDEHGHEHVRSKDGFGPPGKNAASPRHETALRYLLGTMPAAEEQLPLRARRLDWAALLARVWDVDVLRCPRCPNGRMEVIAAISEFLVVAKILAHLKLPTTLPQPCPARAPPWSEAEFDQGELDLDDDDLT